MSGRGAAVPPAPEDISTSVAVATGSVQARALADRYADRYSVLDWLPAGQPDGTAWNGADIQAAINGCAGKASLVFPATPLPYKIGGVMTIPSNSHIIVESGATLALGDAVNAGMFGFIQGANNILFDLFGTLFGNSANQTATSPCFYALGANPNNSNIFIRGLRQGKIFDFKSWPASFTSCVNGEIAGVTIDGGGSVIFAGTSPIVSQSFSGTYNSTTGLLTITTAAPHNLAVGALFTLVNATGTGAFVSLNGQYVVAPGSTGPATSPTVINCIAPKGLGAATLTGGRISTQMIGAVANNPGTVNAGLTATGTYVNPGSATNCTLTLTTSAPHGLSPGSPFWLLNPPITAACPPATGLATGTGTDFAKLIGQQYTAIPGTTGNTIVALATPGLSTPLTITSAGVYVSTASYNVGMDDCIVRNIHDLGVVIYGGDNKGYVRNSDISGCQGGAVCVYSDTAQPGPNFDPDISGNNLWNNPTSAVYIGSNVPGINQVNVTVRSNHAFGNARGAIFIGGTDGVRIENNDLHDNLYYPSIIGTNGLNMSGEISLNCYAKRATIINNDIHNPMISSAAYPNATAGMGIAFDICPDLYIAGNRISDNQDTKTMQACLGGNWGPGGLSHGNNYGPRIATAADVSVYNATSIQGPSYDLTRPLTALAVDGNGNTQIGGALSHNGIQTQSLADGGTLTVNPNVDFVVVNNGALISAGTIVLPKGLNNAELEILFTARVTTLTISPPAGYTVQNAPTTVAAASNAFNFILNGTTWRRRIMT